MAPAEAGSGPINQSAIGKSVQSFGGNNGGSDLPSPGLCAPSVGAVRPTLPGAWHRWRKSGPGLSGTLGGAHGGLGTGFWFG